MTNSLPTPSPSPRSPHYISYRPDIDGLRAIAVLAVVGFHAFSNAVPGGFAGVDVFFVISGFLISSIIFRGLIERTFNFANFYSRRVMRIFPALVVVLISTFVLCWLILLPDEYEYAGSHALSGAGFVLNFELYKESNQYFDQDSPLLHLWSLSVEEQFYLIWPLYIAVIWKYARSPLTLIVAIASMSFCLNVGSIVQDPPGSFYLPTSRLWELVSGAALAYPRIGRKSGEAAECSSNGRRRLLTALLSNGHLMSAFGAALLIASFFYLNGRDLFPGWWALAPVTGTLLLIAGGPNAWINRIILSNRVMIGIGLISYPLYLWHWPLLKLFRMANIAEFTPVTAILVLGVAFILAFFTYRCVELPIRYSSRPRWLPIALCMSLLTCGYIGYLGSTGRITSRQLGQKIERFYRASNDEFLPHNYWGNVDRFIKIGNGSRLVVIIGDSNIFQYYSLIEKLMSDHPSNTHAALIAARGSCALGAAELSRTSEFMKAQCRAFLSKAIQLAEGPSVDAVVIGGAWYGYFIPWRDHDHYGDSAPISPEADRSLDNLRETISTLVSKGKRVDIILQFPVGVKVDPKRMIERTVITPGFLLKIPQLTKDEVSRAIDPINIRLRELAKEAGANVIDPTESLCNKTICPVVTTEGDPIYHDIAHLRPSYIRDHVRYLDRALIDDIDVADTNVKQIAGESPAASPLGVHTFR